MAGGVASMTPERTAARLGLERRTAVARSTGVRKEVPEERNLRRARTGNGGIVTGWRSLVHKD
jgi:hypothetical protein